MSRIVRVPVLLIWFVLGLILILVPWLDSWETNYLFYQYPTLGLLLKNPFMRGAISGLGFMNVLLSLESFRKRAVRVASRS
jgi:hypothetical protein